MVGNAYGSPTLRVPNSHAYLCGPPAMIDSAIECLTRAGVCQEHLFYDKFLDASLMQGGRRQQSQQIVAGNADVRESTQSVIAASPPGDTGYTISALVPRFTRIAGVGALLA